MLYACERCGIRFDADEERCPQCMRKSTVRLAHELARAELEAEIDAHYEAMPRVLLRIGTSVVLSTILASPLLWAGRWAEEVGLYYPLAFGVFVFMTVSVKMSGGSAGNDPKTTPFSDVLGLAAVFGGTIVVIGWLVNVLLPDDLHFLLRGAIAVPLAAVGMVAALRALTALVPGFLRD